MGGAILNNLSAFYRQNACALKCLAGGRSNDKADCKQYRERFDCGKIKGPEQIPEKRTAARCRL
jgi:hypothetical protein